MASITPTEAARRVLQKCLRIRPHENVQVIFDHFGLHLTEHFLEAASTLPHMNIAARLLPIDDQRRLAERRTLPRDIRTDLASADVFIFCVTDSDETTSFRVAVLRLAKANMLRILHMPGVDVRTMTRGATGINFTSLHRRGQRIANALMDRSEAVIETVTASGESHELRLSMHGRKPHVCGGRADPGEIANFPTGEVFIAPIEESACGTLVLNGSTENAVFHDTEEAILFFRAGRLVLGESTFPDRPVSRRLEQHLSAHFHENSDHLLLCELGIGINPAIEELSGDEVWDEKAGGTAHIALGANSPFGGVIDTNYHRDMVFIPRRIRLDGRVLRMKWKEPRRDGPGGNK
jgi:aminopeptidase